MSLQTVKWLNQDFQVYNYEPLNAWSHAPAVYIFAGVNQQNAWFAVYVGQTKSLAERMPNHEYWLAAKRLGATHVHARVVQQEIQRLSLEKSLIQDYNPSLNQQYSR